MAATSIFYYWTGWTIWFAIAAYCGFRSIFSYEKVKSETKLAYQWDAKAIMGAEKGALPAEILATLGEDGNPDVSSSEIVLWNAGKQSLHGSDIAPADPLRIVFLPTTKILRILILSATCETNSFVASQDPEHANVAICTFNHLGPGDGIRLKMFVTDHNRTSAQGGIVRGGNYAITNLGKANLCASETTRPSWWGRYSTHINAAIWVGYLLLQFAVVVRNRHHPGWLFSRGIVDGLYTLFLPFFMFSLQLSRLSQKPEWPQRRFPKRLSNA